MSFFLMFSYVNICIPDDLIGLIIFYLEGFYFIKEIIKTNILSLHHPSELPIQDFTSSLHEVCLVYLCLADKAKHPRRYFPGHRYLDNYYLL